MVVDWDLDRNYSAVPGDDGDRCIVEYHNQTQQNRLKILDIQVYNEVEYTDIMQNQESNGKSWEKSFFRQRRIYFAFATTFFV